MGNPTAMAPPTPPGSPSSCRSDTPPTSLPGTTSPAAELHRWPGDLDGNGKADLASSPAAVRSTTPPTSPPGTNIPVDSWADTQHRPDLDGNGKADPAGITSRQDLTHHQPHHLATHPGGLDPTAAGDFIFFQRLPIQAITSAGKIRLLHHQPHHSIQHSRGWKPVRW